MKKKKIAFGTLATTLTLSAVAAVVVSCGSTDDDVKSNKWIKFNGANEEVNDFINTLAKKGQTADANQIKDVLKKSVSYLYDKEQKASENMKKLREQSIRKHAKRRGENEEKAVKDAGIKSLDKIIDIEKRVKAEFDDEQTAYKKLHGHGWEKTWPAELAKNKKYGSARSDKEAIDNMVNSQLANNAFGRFTIDKSTTWYKADLDPKAKDSKDFEWLRKIEAEGLVFSSDKKTELDKLDKDEKIIVVGTKSFDTNQQKIKPIIESYLEKYDPMVVNHLLLKAVPDEKEGFAPWKIDSLETLKAWLVPTPQDKTTIDSFSSFKGLHWDAKKKDFAVTDEDSNLLKSWAVGNSKGTQGTGGSLGLQDELDYVSGMVPGFALPILTFMGEDNIQSGNNGWMKINPRDPFVGITKGTTPAPTTTPKNTSTNPKTSTTSSQNLLSRIILDKLTEATMGSGKTFKGEFKVDMKDHSKWYKAIERLFKTFGSDKKVADSKILEIAGNVIRDQFSNKGERDLIYTSGNNKVVLSKFGIHLINGFTIQKLAKDMGNVSNTEALLKTIKSDVQRTAKGESAYFNTLNNVTKNSGDKMFILESLINDKDFIKYLKSQENFGAPSSEIKGDAYPKYTDTIINNIKNKYIGGYKITRTSSRAKSATEKLKSWMNTSFQNETLNGQTNNTDWSTDQWKESLDTIYKTAITIADKGAGK